MLVGDDGGNAVKEAFLLAGFICACTYAQAFSLDEASALYRAKVSKSPPSVVECGDYVFVILEGYEADTDTSNMKRVILKGQLESLGSYVGKSTGTNISPFSSRVTDKLLPLAGFRLPECQSCTVENVCYRGKYRHVSAFEAKPLLTARETAKSGVPVRRTVREWSELIDRKLTAVGSVAEQEQLWAEIGATFAVIPHAGGGDWLLNGVDGVAAAELASTWCNEAPARSCHAALKVNPAFAPAHLRLASLWEQKGDLPRAISRIFKGSIGRPEVGCVSRLANVLAEKNSSPAWSEYAALYAAVLERTPRLRSGKRPFWRYVVNSFGHLSFGPLTGDAKARVLFDESRDLYGKGQELEKIIALLIESIERDPGDSAKWRYLGAALRTAGESLDAVVAYHEALVLNPDDQLVGVDLCLLYDRLGYAALAAGNAWYCLHEVTDEALREKAGKVLHVEP